MLSNIGLFHFYSNDFAKFMNFWHFLMLTTFIFFNLVILNFKQVLFDSINFWLKLLKASALICYFIVSIYITVFDCYENWQGKYFTKYDLCYFIGTEKSCFYYNCLKSNLYECANDDGDGIGDGNGNNGCGVILLFNFVGLTEYLNFPFWKIRSDGIESSYFLLIFLKVL